VGILLEILIQLITYRTGGSKMRRTIVAVAAALAVLTTGVVPSAHAGIKKPTKIDCSKDLAVAAPAGCTIAGILYPIGGPQGYGTLAVTFVQPAITEGITLFTLTCTPTPGASATVDYPVDPIVDTFAVSPSGGRYISLNSRFRPSGTGASDSGTAGRITLWSSQFPGDRSPSAKCKVDATNAGGTTAGKSPKLPTGSGSNCGVLNGENPPVDPDPAVTPVNPGDGSTATPATGALFLRTTIVSGPINVGTFCTTDRGAYPKWLTDQMVIFSGATKVKTKTKTATLKKFKLTAPLSSSIPLNTTGSLIVYKFDQTKLQAVTTGAPGSKICEVSAAKAPGKTNSCTFDNSAGTITVSGNDTLLIKVGKPIISPTITVNFTYTGAPDTTSITLVKSQTHIKIGVTDVDVTVDDTASCNSGLDGVVGTADDFPTLTNAQLMDPAFNPAEDGTSLGGVGNPLNLCFEGQGLSDPNYNRPLITFTGLL